MNVLDVRYVALFQNKSAITFPLKFVPVSSPENERHLLKLHNVQNCLNPRSNIFLKSALR